MENVLARKNTIAISPTGGGKSICYQLPAVLMEGTAIVVSPLIALMKSQVDFLNTKQVQAGLLNSTLSKKKVLEVKQAMQAGDLKLLYIAPETLNKPTTIDFLRTIQISFIAIDEVHCISDWGHDFRPEYRKLKHTLECLNQPSVIALTATATPQVQQDILRNLQISDANKFIISFDRPNLYYEVCSKHNLQRKLIEFIKQQAHPTGIVYCQSRKRAEMIASFLEQNQIRALPYHAGLDTKTRNRNQDAFLARKVNVIVATIAFGMGIDKPDVRFVVHCDTPKSLESYYQETGRAGRDGEKAHCLLFYAREDIEKLERLNRDKLVSQRKNLKVLLESMRCYAELSVCRRKQILAYFGEGYEGQCKNCDNCVDPRATYDGKPHLEKILKVVQLTKEKLGEEQLLSILRGVEDAHVLDHAYHKLSIFGSGKAEAALWPSVIKQAILFDYLARNPEDPSLLQLTPRGMAFLKKPHSIALYEDHQYNLLEATERQTKGDATLLGLLQTLREQEAAKHKLKPFLVFQDSMLERMSESYPTTIKMLTRIAGVGMHKAEKFGEPFVTLIAKYVQKHDIQPKKSIVVRQNADKFANRIQIIQQVDHKIDLEEIAKKRKLSFEELIEELENICSSGVRLDLHYYIDSILDEDQQEVLYDHFHNNEVKDTQAICRAFHGEYSEEVIRLAYVQFLSEVAKLGRWRSWPWTWQVPFLT